jgi:hypothetical protein
MPTLEWKEITAMSKLAETEQRARWEARHKTTTLIVWVSEGDDRWGWEIRERSGQSEQIETSAAPSLQAAQDEAEARARDRGLLR